MQSPRSADGTCRSAGLDHLHGERDHMPFRPPFHPFAVLSGVLACSSLAAPLAASPGVELVSGAAAGAPATAPAGVTVPFANQRTLTADGRYVVFVSNALNLAPEANGKAQVFLRDLRTGDVELISRSIDGTPGDRGCYDAAISADGRYVAFDSAASNLVAGGTNGPGGIFVRDRERSTTERVRLGSGDGELDAFSGGPLALSDDGRFVAFTSLASDLAPGDADGAADIFVHDRSTGSIELVSVHLGPPSEDAANDYPRGVSLSADGRYVAFAMERSDLVGGDTNGYRDVFLRDRVAGTLTRISVSDDGAQADGESSWPCLSADGRFVIFETFARNLAGRSDYSAPRIILRDLEADTNEVVNTPPAGGSPGWAMAPSLSRDGRWAIFAGSAPDLVPGDPSPNVDLFLRDLQSGTTERVSVTTGGAIVEHGQVLIFSVASVSDGGSTIAFYSDATDLVPDDTNGLTDCFVRTRAPGGGSRTDRASVAPDGAQGTGGAHAAWPAMTPDGRYVAFVSNGQNMVADAPANTPQVYLRDYLTGELELISSTPDGAAGNGGCSTWCAPAMTPDGRFVTFVSSASDLVPGDTNGGPDVFVRDRVFRTTERVNVRADGSEADTVDEQGVAVSVEGRFVAFSSGDRQLVPDDANPGWDIFVRDRWARTNTRVSVQLPGEARRWSSYHCYSPVMSANGRRVGFVAFSRSRSEAQIYIRDRIDHRTDLVSASPENTEADGWSAWPAVSADGQAIAFISTAHNLGAANAASGQANVFVRFLNARRTYRVSSRMDGSPIEEGVSAPALGRAVEQIAFHTTDPGLVPGDLPFTDDVFVVEPLEEKVERVSLTRGGRSAHGGPLHDAPALSAWGRYVTFSSDAALVPSDENGTADLYVRDREGTAPYAPGNLEASLATNGVLISWQAYGEDAMALAVERKPEGGSYDRIATLRSTDRYYTDVTAAAGTRYLYRVRALNRCGSALSQAVRVTTRKGVPRLKSITPSPIRVTGGVSVQLAVTLTDPPFANGVDVQLWSTDPRLATVPLYANVRYPLRTRQFVVRTRAVKARRTIQVMARYQGRTRSASITLLP
jgi:Tol biopolymer transport system component